MYKVFVLVCSLYAPDNCIVGVDNVNVYPTQVECKARAFEINKEITLLAPGWHVAMFKCEQTESI